MRLTIITADGMIDEETRLVLVAVYSVFHLVFSHSCSHRNYHNTCSNLLQILCLTVPRANLNRNPGCQTSAWLILAFFIPKERALLVTGVLEEIGLRIAVDLEQCNHLTAEGQGESLGILSSGTDPNYVLTPVNDTFSLIYLVHHGDKNGGRTFSSSLNHCLKFRGFQVT